MYSSAEKVFYGLSIFLLGMALFIFTPNPSRDIASFQSEARTSLSIAWQQTLGDQPYFTEVGEVVDGLTMFYDQATSSMIAMLSMPSADADIAQVFGQTYRIFAQSVQTHKVGPASEASLVTQASFMAEQPIFNIIPTQNAISGSGQVSGQETQAFTNPAQVVNLSNPWFTAIDAMTGQKYCMAIYNGEVNKYLGPCKNDYH